MRGFKAGIVIAAAFVTAALGFMSCSSDSAKLISITVTPVDPVSVVGTQFTATGTFSDGMILNYTSEVIWSSSNTDVATVGSSGYATVVSSGITTITATEPYNNFSSSSTLTIAQSMTVTIDPEVLSMVTGTSHQFTATGTYYLSSGATITQSLMSSPSLTWNSSDITVATVSQGLVTAGTTTGTVEIYATDLISNATGTAIVTITDTP